MPPHLLPTIYVDTRETTRPHPTNPSRTVGVDMLELIRRHRDSPVAEPRFLHAGDFMFTGNGPGEEPALIGIERKRMKDMVNSIRGGRLSGEQLPKLVNYDFPYIIFESRWKTDWFTGQLMEHLGRDWQPVLSGTAQVMTGLEINSYLNDIRDHTPVTVLYTEDPRQTVEVLMSLAYSWCKPWADRHHHVDIHRPDKYKQIERNSTVRRFAFALDDVGWKRSGDVEEHFKTVDQFIHQPEQCPKCERQICNPVTPKDWARLPGFGKVLSKKVYNQLHGLNQEEK